MSGTLVICTRNRPDDLARTLAGIDTQRVSFPLDLLVVDAGDPAAALASQSACRRVSRFPLRYVRYAGAPSLARQRNLALDLLDASARVVFFVDDDVTLDPGYLETLWQVFEDCPDVLGAGGRIRRDTTRVPRSAAGRVYRRLFLLESRQPGRVLPSGGESQTHTLDLQERTGVQWLSGCSCAYRPEAARRHRFDHRLEGYSLDEDLDFSYRVGRDGRLLLEPRATLVHHRSPRERHENRRYASDYLVHRYWFVEKNIRHPLRRLAFWWSVLGRLGLTVRPRDPHATETRKGYLDAIRIILSRAHPLLTMPGAPPSPL